MIGLSGANDWILYFVDNENIYLIADNYVPRDDWPLTPNGTRVYEAQNSGGWGMHTCPDTDYGTTFHTLSMDNCYTKGSAEITDDRIKKKNSMYYESRGFLFVSALESYCLLV